MAKDTLIRGARGYYKIATVTGAMAAGAATREVLQMRWTDTDNLALITSIELTGMRATTAFAVGTIDIKATIARTWTANGTGGTDIEVGSGDSHTTDNGLLRSNAPNSLFTDIRVATTASLGAGTKTLATTDVGNVITHSSGGVGAATPIIGSIYLPKTTLFKTDFADGQYPIVLTANEGLVIQVTIPATGVWNLGMEVSWVEVEEKNF